MNRFRFAKRDRLGGFALRTGFPAMKTKGWLHGAEQAWVYVGATRRGVIKIGMSSNPQWRCAEQRLRLVHSVEVVPAAAKLVETEALAALDRRRHDTEWVRHVTEEQAIRAVAAAFIKASRYRHVDPALTVEEARAARVSLATHAGLA